MLFKNKGFKEYLPILFLAILIALFFGKTLFPPAGKILYGGDINDQFYYWKSFFAQNIKNGIVPFWNPYSFSGTPFLAHPSTAAFYPFNAIFLLFPINTAFSIYLFVHISLAAVFMYLLLRKHTDVLSSLAGGVVFSLSGLLAARIYAGHVDIISTLVWVPAVFASFDTALRTRVRKNIILAIFAFTMQILAGYQAVVIFTLEMIFIYQLVVIVISHCELKVKQSISINKDRHASLAMTNGIKSFLTLFFIIIISFGLSAVQLLPTLEFVRNSIRGGGLPYGSLTWGSFIPDSLLTFIQPFRYGNPFPESYTYNGPGPNFFELSYFMGIIPILLFLSFTIDKLISYCSRRKAENALNKLSVNFSLRSKNISVIGLIIALIFFVLVAMGNNTPLYHLLYNISPPYRLFRFPSQHLMMAVFIIALITGLSTALVKNSIFKLVILLLITAELFSYDSKFIGLGEIPTESFDHNLTSMLSKDTEIVRVLPDYSVVSSVRQAWDFESSMYYKIQTTSGYNPILLANYYHFIDLVNNKYTSSLAQYNVEIPPPDPSSEDIDFLNVKYLLADKNYDSVKDKSLDKYIFIKEGETYRLYENKNYLPRFFINCSGKNIQKVDIIDYQLNNIRLKTDSLCDGILSSSEVYYPGWQAKIDGKTVSVYQSNTAFRAISLPKGNHLVEFYYQPTVYYIGGIISLLSVVAIFVILKRTINKCI